jgi:hypothetical protein
LEELPIKSTGWENIEPSRAIAGLLNSWIAIHPMNRNVAIAHSWQIPGTNGALAKKADSKGIG